MINDLDRIHRHCAKVEAALRKAGKGGRIFHVQFQKRTTGEIRDMNARLGVKSHLRGGPSPYVPKDHNLIVVYEMPGNGYKAIPLDGVLLVNNLPV